MTLDELLSKTYNKMEYNCFHFMLDAYEFFYGENIKDVFMEFLQSGLTTRRKTTMFRKCGREDAQIVLINYWNGLHCGLVVNGRLLHLTEERDVRWDTIEQAELLSLKSRYYEYNKDN